jgi:GNAT superfamily N-acetyltransferase
MSKPYTLRLATEQDLPAVYIPILERVVWLRDNGYDQWSTWKTWPERITTAIEERRTWILLDGESIVGTVTTGLEGDSDFWNDEELQDKCLYLHKLATRPGHAGKELGNLMLSWARDQALELGLDVVRIDCWRSNTKLHEYYKQRGWRYVRTEAPEHRQSGVLFEISPQKMPAEDAARISVIE